MTAIFRQLLSDPRFDIVAEDLQTLDVGIFDCEAAKVDVPKLGSCKVPVVEHGVGK